MKFKKVPRTEPRPITKRRLKCAEKALQKERDKFPLLVDWVAEQQPTPIERLKGFQQGEISWEQSNRKYIADRWRRSRKYLYQLPAEERKKLIQEWNEHPCLPKTHEYFGDFLCTRVPWIKEEAIKRLDEECKSKNKLT